MKELMENFRRAMKEMIDPEYMKQEILGLAEIVDEEGMAVIMELIEAPFNGNLDDAFDAVEGFVASAKPEMLKWLHENIDAEGLWDHYGQ